MSSTRYIRCNWERHCIADLLTHKSQVHLIEEPDLHIVKIEEDRLAWRAINRTTLRVSGPHAEMLTAASTGATIGNLTSKPDELEITFMSINAAHLNLKLDISVIANLGWDPTRAGTPNVIGKQLREIRNDIRYKWLKPDDKVRLENLYKSYCDFSKQQQLAEWEQRVMEIGAKGIFRATLLGEFGVRPINDTLAQNLSSGQFRDHFEKHWPAMHMLFQDLSHEKDWEWASKAWFG